MIRFKIIHSDDCPAVGNSSRLTLNHNVFQKAIGLKKKWLMGRRFSPGIVAGATSAFMRGINLFFRPGTLRQKLGENLLKYDFGPRLALACALGTILALFGAPVKLGAGVVPGDDFGGNTQTAIQTLQQWYNSSGLWDTTGWWNAANCLDAVEEGIVAANGGSNLLYVITNTYNLNSGSSFLNSYYDDEGWWAEAWIKAYDLTADPRYLNAAKTIFADMTNAWGNPCGGGIWWDKPHSYKNAIANELFLVNAIRLHERTPGDSGSGSYLAWATNEWNWFKASGMLNGAWLVNDGLDTNCQNNGQTTWTYNQGVVVGGLTELYKVTGNTNYLHQAELIASAAIGNLVDTQRILREPCEPNCGGDAPQFKGIFMRHLAELYDVDHKSANFNFLFTNAHSIWFHDRNNQYQLGLTWDGPFDSADAARQSSAITPIAALAEPVTPWLPFCRGAGDPYFNHAGGAAAGALGWTCGPANPTSAGFLQTGPFFSQLQPGSHVAHFRMAVDATSSSTAKLVYVEVWENGSLLNDTPVAWNTFGVANETRDYQVPFTNQVAGGTLEFKIYWFNIPGTPNLTVTDVTVDGSRNWTAANLDHDLGRLDGVNNWETDNARDTNSGYLARGPRTSELGAGFYSATFELAVDNFCSDTANVATISVVDVDHGKTVATRDTARSEFPNILFRTFELHFAAQAGVHYDFRTWWNYSTNAPRLTLRSVVLKPAGAAAFSPLLLSAKSYNLDIIIEKSAAHPPVNSTTATMDDGTSNGDNTWYEQGYNLSALSSGLPLAGSLLTNVFASDHVYLLAGSYQSNNVVLIDGSHNASVVPLFPQACAELSVLTSGGHGPVGVNYRLDHQDGTSERGLFAAPDWFFNLPYAYIAQGRYNYNGNAFNSVNSGEPRLYSVDLTVSNTASAITNIAFTSSGGSGEAAVFAMSAVASPSVGQSQILVAPRGRNLVLWWYSGALLSATDPNGPWVTNSGASAPFEVTPGNGNAFYRLVAQ